MRAAPARDRWPARTRAQATGPRRPSGMAGLLQRDMPGGVTYEEHRHRQRRGRHGRAPTASTSRAAKSAASQPLIPAASATPPYPADSLSPSARPRRRGPTRSIFITTVIDHARPWLTPSRTLAATIQPQLGARAISSGTGSATIQPAISRRRRPARWASAPALRLVSALAKPKAMMNDRTAALEVSPKSSRAMSGSVERSSPTIAPTKTLTATSSRNCARFSRSPSRIVVALTLGRPQVLEQIGVGIDDCASAAGLAARWVGGASAVVVEQSSEGHVRASRHRKRWKALTSYQGFY